jgi:RNA exonuclease 4
MHRRGKTLKALKKKAAAAATKQEECADASVVQTTQKRKCIVDVSDTAHGPTSMRKRPRSTLTIKEAVQLQINKKEKLEGPPTSSISIAPPHPAVDDCVSLDDQTRYVALDCEMVGTGANGKSSVLARACVVDFHGTILYDSFVKVAERVTDFRTEFSGVRPANLKGREATTFAECAAEIAGLLKGRVLVGHALRNDLSVLMLSHPRQAIRDTATYRPFMRFAHGKFKPRKLKDLAREHIRMDIQGGEHTPDEDARAAMLLYRSKRKEWEANLRIFKGGGLKSKKVGVSKPGR